jgi:hypothetical protein
MTNAPKLRWRTGKRRDTSRPDRSFQEYSHGLLTRNEVFINGKDKRFSKGLPEYGTVAVHHCGQCG